MTPAEGGGWPEPPLPLCLSASLPLSLPLSASLSLSASLFASLSLRFPTPRFRLLLWQLLFLDEPTSGLDAFAAQQVVRALKRLADDGTTIIMSIHQPRGSIYNMFDDLLLLAEGKVVHAADGSAL